MLTSVLVSGRQRRFDTDTEKRRRPGGRGGRDWHYATTGHGATKIFTKCQKTEEARNGVSLIASREDSPDATFISNLQLLEL